VQSLEIFHARRGRVETGEYQRVVARVKVEGKAWASAMVEGKDGMQEWYQETQVINLKETMEKTSCRRGS
jgi:hypothetical protein